MLDDEGSKRFFQELNKIWIEPEIARRRSLGQWSSDMRISRCLIRMPKGASAIVEFNDEIKWEAQVKIDATESMKIGDPVLLSQVKGVESVKRPTVDGIPVAFTYFYFDGLNIRTIFDWSPNNPVFEETSVEDESWALGKSIANAINAQLESMVVQFHEANKQSLAPIGLWAVPSLMPHPMSAIIDACRGSDFDKARETLLKHCDIEFLNERVESWSNIQPFTERASVVSRK